MSPRDLLDQLTSDEQSLSLLSCSAYLTGELTKRVRQMFGSLHLMLDFILCVCMSVVYIIWFCVSLNSWCSPHENPFFVIFIQLIL